MKKLTDLGLTLVQIGYYSSLLVAGVAYEGVKLVRDEIFQEKRPANRHEQQRAQFVYYPGDDNYRYTSEVGLRPAQEG